jgi:hypothetical protein
VTTAGVPIADLVIENRDQLVEALRSRKGQLGLSNAFVEAQLHMTSGGCDKVLGPSQIKGFSLAVMFDLVELFGARLVLRFDAEAEARMQARWERRDERRVRRQKRVSKELLELARPHLMRALGKSGGAKRAASIPASLASKIGRRAGRARMQQLTREQRSALVRTAAQARWQQHAVKAASISEGASA